jgi:hypothetical protein
MKSILIIATAALVAGCSDAPDFDVSGGPVDPSAPVPTQRYVPVTVGTVDYKPVEPQPWKERNQKVAPEKEQQP